VSPIPTIVHCCTLLYVQLRYNFRLYPDASQREALARSFGCARVVFNDGLVRHEVLRDRVEVKDHHHRAVAAVREKLGAV